MGNNRVTYKDIMDFQEKVFHELTEVRGDIAGIGASLAAGEANFKAINKRLDTNETSIVRVRNLNTGIALITSTIAGILGWNK